MKIADLKPGMRVWNTMRYKMGNTTISTLGAYQIHVYSVFDDHVMASWNGNQIQKYYAHQVAKWKKAEPIMVRECLGSHRLANREEKKQILAARKLKEQS